MASVVILLPNGPMVRIASGFSVRIAFATSVVGKWTIWTLSNGTSYCSRITFSNSTFACERPTTPMRFPARSSIFLDAGRFCFLGFVRDRGVERLARCEQHGIILPQDRDHLSVFRESEIVAHDREIGEAVFEHVGAMRRIIRGCDPQPDRGVVFGEFRTQELDQPGIVAARRADRDPQPRRLRQEIERRGGQPDNKQGGADQHQPAVSQHDADAMLEILLDRITPRLHAPRFWRQGECGGDACA